jgi:hypothetical protein
MPQSLNVSDQMSVIRSQFRQGRNVIVNTQNLTPGEVSQLQQEVAPRGWSQRVLFGAP